MVSNRIFTGCVNTILVKLGWSYSKKRFSVATLALSKEFRHLVTDSDKGLNLENGLSQFKSKVFWCYERPYAFINVKLIGKGEDVGVMECVNVPKNFNIVNYVPEVVICKGIASKDKIRLTMNVCVDFSVKNVILDSVPQAIDIYLRFHDVNSVPKKEVLEQVFFVNKCFNDKLEIITCLLYTSPSPRDS